MTAFTHLSASGEAHMVDVSDKPTTVRSATATGTISLTQDICEQLQQNTNPKGEVFSVARVAGIQAAKQCAGLIPLCHQLPLSKVAIEFQLDSVALQLKVFALVKTTASTGVEMEALTAVSVSLLTVYDMCKALSQDMVIGEIQVLQKHGGTHDIDKSK